jgi:hypothetical protein
MRGNADHTTRDAVLTFLRVAGEPRPVRQICRYMHVMHKTDGGATRECLQRLVRAGHISHPARGYYAWCVE